MRADRDRRPVRRRQDHVVRPAAALLRAGPGLVRLDGEDISALPRAEVRRRIAYVEQDAPALAGTIRENLLFAAPDATDEAITEVLAATRLDSLIDRHCATRSPARPASARSC